MYKPKFNSILVELQREEWGSGNDDSMLGKSYNIGKVVERGELIPTDTYPSVLSDKGFDATSVAVDKLIGKEVLFNEGVEAGTVFDGEDGKQYGFIYWWDVRGCKE